MASLQQHDALVPVFVVTRLTAPGSRPHKKQNTEFSDFIYSWIPESTYANPKRTAIDWKWLVGTHFHTEEGDQASDESDINDFIANGSESESEDSADGTSAKGEKGHRRLSSMEVARAVELEDEEDAVQEVKDIASYYESNAAGYEYEDDEEGEEGEEEGY